VQEIKPGNRNDIIIAEKYSVVGFRAGKVTIAVEHLTIEEVRCRLVDLLSEFDSIEIKCDPMDECEVVVSGSPEEFELTALGFTECQKNSETTKR
jgi:hypothetical protein